MDPDKIKDLEERFLCCNICEEDILSSGKELHLLPCQHHLCAQCIDKWMRNRSLKCPYCIKTFSLPKSGNFPLFRFAADLSDFVKDQVKDSKKPKEAMAAESITEKGDMKPVLLQEFDYIVPQLTYLCWGNSGKLYVTNHTTNPLKPQGLYSIDVVKGEVQRFGYLESTYEGGLFIGEELFVYNCTTSYMEVYKDERPVREWHKCFFEMVQLVWMARHPIGGLLILFKMRNGEVFPYHSDIFGQRIEFPRNNKSAGYIEMLRRSRVRSAYRSSIWLIDRKDEILWEIPVEQRFQEIIYKEAIRHCKISNCTYASELEDYGIVYRESTDNRVLKVLDLAVFDEPAKSEDMESGRRRRGKRGNHSAVGKSVLTFDKFKTLLNDVEGKKIKVSASIDGFLAVLGDDAVLKVYATDKTTMQVYKDTNTSTRQLTTSNMIIPGPTYFKAKTTNWTIFYFLIGLFPYLIYWLYTSFSIEKLRAEQQEALRTMCRSLRRQNGDIWSSLYRFFCN